MDSISYVARATNFLSRSLPSQDSLFASVGLRRFPPFLSFSLSLSLFFLSFISPFIPDSNASLSRPHRVHVSFRKIVHFDPRRFETRYDLTAFIRTLLRRISFRGYDIAFRNADRVRLGHTGARSKSSSGGRF